MRADRQAIPDVDRADRHQKYNDFLFAERVHRPGPDVIRDSAFIDQRDRLRQRDRGFLPFGIQARRLAPTGEHVDAAVIDTGLTRFATVHVEAVRASVEL